LGLLQNEPKPILSVFLLYGLKLDQ